MTDKNFTAYFTADEQGRLIIPPETALKYGIQPGSRVLAETGTDGLIIHRSPFHLAKLYFEPTNLCNLQCRTCIRNTWSEPMGKMSKVVFERVMKGIQAFTPLPHTVFFGGFGEPLFHPDIVEMIAMVKQLGLKAAAAQSTTTAPVLRCHSKRRESPPFQLWLNRTSISRNRS